MSTPLFNIIRSWKFMTPAEQADTALDPGKPTKQVTGSYIDDLVNLRLAIWLCGLCERKWRPAKVGYVTKRTIPFVRGKCDGCQDSFGQMRLFVHQTIARIT